MRNLRRLQDFKNGLDPKDCCERSCGLGFPSDLPSDEGVAAMLRPYLEDLLVRRQGFRGAVDFLATAADAYLMRML